MEKKISVIINILFYGLIVALILGFCKYIFPVLVPFVLGFLVASFLQIFVRKICRRYEKHKRMVSILLCILFYVVLFLLATFVGVKVVDFIWSFVESIPDLYHNTLVPVISQLSHMINDYLTSTDIGIAGEVDRLFQEILNTMEEFITTISVNAVRFVSDGIVGIPGFVIKLVLTVVSSFFFIVDYDGVMALIGKCIPKGKEKTFHDIKAYVIGTIGIYLKSYSLLFLLTYVELCIGFLIIGIPYAPLVAMMVAVFDILPVLGTGGILLPWAVILAFMKEIPMAVGMVILYLVITIIRNTLEPKLVGKQIGLHPLATLIFLYVGLKMMGIVGMFLFPVTLAVIVNMKRDEVI